MVARSCGRALGALLSLSCSNASAPPAAVPVVSTTPMVEVADEIDATEEDATLDARALDDATLARLLALEPEAVGSLSVGKPNAGALVNAVRMPEDPAWELVAPHRAWATEETVDALSHALVRLHQQFPKAHPIYIGHMSGEHGGPIRPHRSHQSGRDVDISYCYRPDKAAWYQKAGTRTLDLPCSWALVRTLVTETDVEYIFVERYVQKLLREHAESVGEDAAWLDQVFQYGSHRPEPIVRHAWGHATHLHVRFYNPRAQELAARTFDTLVARGLVKPGNWLRPVAAIDLPARRLPPDRPSAGAGRAVAAHDGR